MKLIKKELPKENATKKLQIIFKSFCILLFHILGVLTYGFVFLVSSHFAKFSGGAPLERMWEINYWWSILVIFPIISGVSHIIYWRTTALWAKALFMLTITFVVVILPIIIAFIY